MLKQLVRNSTQLLFPVRSNYDVIAKSYQPQQFSDTVFLLSYAELATKQAIKDNKYYRTPAAACTLAAILAKYTTKFSGQPIHIIPIPQSYKRWRERGFHHLEEIISQSTLEKRIKKDILSKVIHTKRQAYVSKKQRHLQQINSFSCARDKANALEGIVILFDDVVTTGATMQAARATLAPHLGPEAKLICLALAH